MASLGQPGQETYVLLTSFKQQKLAPPGSFILSNFFVFVLPSGNSGLQGMYRLKISKDVVLVHTVNILQVVVHFFCRDV